MAQGGSRNRSFVYDSLKRLTSSGNPESGGTTTPVTYTYDADNNVLTKKDARAIITITYSWDKLNRMLGKTYSNGDSSVSYSYDSTACVVVSSCYNVGRMTGMTDAAGSESFAYDKMGRIWGDTRTNHGVHEKHQLRVQSRRFAGYADLSQRKNHNLCLSCIGKAHVSL